MPWIKTIEYEDASGPLKRVYDKVKGPDDNVDNVLRIHSLRPHTLKGHMTLYKSVLHNSNNTLLKSFLETIGVYVSYLNKCNYCVQHHFSGLQRLLNDNERADEILGVLQSGQLESGFDEKELIGLKYARQLTLEHWNITEFGIIKMRDAGYTDGEILEINQVTCYFNYVNRMVVGLGVNLEGDIIGLSPNESSDPNDWSHK